MSGLVWAVIIVGAAVITVALYGLWRLRQLAKRVAAHDKALRLSDKDGEGGGGRRHLRALPVVAPVAAAGAWMREHPAAATVLVGTTAVLAVVVPASVPPAAPPRPPVAAPRDAVEPPRTVEPGEPLDPGGPPAPPIPPPSTEPIPPPTDVPAAGTPPAEPPVSPRPAPAQPRVVDDDEVPQACRTRVQVLDVIDLCVPELPGPPGVDRPQVGRR